MRKHPSFLGFAVFLLLSLLVGWRALGSLFSLAWHDSGYTYVLLILPISAVMLWLNRASVGAVTARNLPAGTALLVAAVAVAAFAWGGFAGSGGDGRLFLAIFALVLWWWGTFVLWFGLRAARASLFPLGFLLFLIPPPSGVMEAAVTWLQDGSAWAAHLLFAAVGVPVQQAGTYLVIPGLNIEVAQECSSIRSSTMLLFTTIVLAQLLLRSPWHKIAVALIAVPLSVAKNAVRICTIALLGTHVDAGYLTGNLHHHGGVVFFAAALAVIFGLLWVFRRYEFVRLRPA